MKSARVLFLLTAVFLGALALLLPPNPGYAFSLHMGRHLMLQLVVPVFLLLGLPQPRWAVKRRRPFVNWILGVGAMWFWHAPALCNAAARSPWLEGVQVLTLLLAGIIFWGPIVGPARIRLTPLLGMIYLFSACLGCTILGIIITFAPPGLYLAASLPGALHDWQFASPVDQRVGGLLMWVPGCLVYFCGVMGLMARWYGWAAPSREGIA